MTEKEILKIFKTEKALLSGHFLLSSGLHSGRYMQCARVLQKPWIAGRLCRELAKKLKGVGVDCVIGPALGGVLVSYEMSRALGIRSLFVERVDGVFALRRGFSLKKGEKALVVEDVVTTGKSSYEVIELLKEHNARPTAVAALVDRSSGATVFTQDFYSLLKIDIKTYKPGVCPLCKQGRIPLVKPGSREPKP